MVKRTDYWDRIDPDDFREVEEGDVVDVLSTGKVLHKDEQGWFITGWELTRPHFVQPDPSGGMFFVYPMEGYTGADIQNGLPAGVEVADSDFHRVESGRLHKTPDDDETLGVYLYEEGGSEHAIPYHRSDIPDAAEVEPYIRSHDDAEDLAGERIVAVSSDGYVDEMVFRQGAAPDGPYAICHTAGDPCYDWYLPASPKHDDRERSIIAIQPDDVDVSMNPADHLDADDTTTTDDTSESADTTGDGLPDVDGYPMFDVLAKENNILRPAIEAIDRFVDEAIIHVTKDRMYSRAVNAENVAQTEVDIPASNFHTYSTTPGKFAVNVSQLADALGEIGKDDAVKLSGDPDDREVEVTDIEAGESVATLPMIDPDAARNIPDTPELDLPVSVEMNAGQFGRCVLASKEVASHVTMGIGTEDGTRSGDKVFKVVAEGDRDTVIAYPDFEFGPRTYNPSRTASHYSLDYINSARLAVDKPASTEITLRFGTNEYPTQMEFTIGDAPGAEVETLISPRVQSGGKSTGVLDEYGTDTFGLDDVSFVAQTDGGKAKQMFEYFGTTADEYRLAVSDLGLETRATDPSNVMMNAVEVSPGYFDFWSEEGGFPDQPIGVPHGRVENILKRFRQTDTFTLAHNPQTRYISIKHDIFTLRMATIDPDAIRADPQLPALELPGRATVTASSFNNAVYDLSTKSDHLVLTLSDGHVYLVTTDDDAEHYQEVTTHSTDGRAFSALSAEYLTAIADATPTDDSNTIDLRAGVEMPLAVEDSLDGGDLSALHILSPRISRPDSDIFSDVRDALSAEPVDLSWTTDGDAGDEAFDAFGDFESEPISERQRKRRLREYPVETHVSYSEYGGDGRLKVAESDDMAVPESTIEAVKDDVRRAFDLDILPSGESVANVTFTSDSDYDIEYLNVQPDFEYRYQTEDGTRMARIVKKDDDYGYVSSDTATPSRQQVVVRAAADRDGDGYAVYVGAKPKTETAEDIYGEKVSDGHTTITGAYSTLLDYLDTHSIEELVREAGLEVTLSDDDVRDQLEDITDEYVDYQLQAKPGRVTEDAPWYASIVGTLNILPDGNYRADIQVLKPESPDGGYEVRYTLAIEAAGPGDTHISYEVVSDTVGVADTRDEIAGLVQASFDALESYGDVYTRREHKPAPPRSPGALPPLREGEISEFVEAYLPESKGELESRMQNHDPPLPVKLTNVDGIGPARAETLTATGVEDVLDFVALAGTKKHTFIGQTLLDLPSAARDTLRGVAAEVWEDIIWPLRDAPEGYEPATTTAPPEPEPDDTGREKDQEGAEQTIGQGLMTVTESEITDLLDADYESAVSVVEETDFPLSLSEVTGIGDSTAEKLEDAGIENTVDLAVIHERMPNGTGDDVRDIIESIPPQYQSDAEKTIKGVLGVIQRVESPGQDTEDDEQFIGDLTAGELEAYAAHVAPGTSVKTGKRAGERAVELEDANPEDLPEFEDTIPVITIEGEDIQGTLQHVAHAWNDAVDEDTIDPDDVNAAREKVEDDLGILLPDAPEPEGDEEPDSTGAGGDSGDQQTWAKFSSIITESGEKAERRERLAAEVIEEMVLDEYGDIFSDAVVGLEFSTEGLEVVRIGGFLSEDGEERLASSDVWKTITAYGDPSNPQAVYEKFRDLVAMLDPERPGHEDFKERLSEAADLSMFKLENGIADPSLIFFPASMVREFIQLANPDLWRKKMRAHMENISAAYRVAQEVHECDTGSKAMCDNIEGSISGDLMKYSRGWLREKAYTQMLQDEFDPAEFFAYYHQSKKAGGRRDEPAFPIEGGEPAEAPSTTEEPEEPTEPEPEREPEREEEVAEPEPEPEPEPEEEPTPTEREGAGAKRTRGEIADDINDHIDTAREAIDTAEDVLEDAREHDLSGEREYERVEELTGVVDITIEEVLDLDPREALDHARDDLETRVNELASATDGLRSRVEEAERTEEARTRERERERAPEPEPTPEDPFSPSGRQQYYVFVTSGLNPTVYVSPNQSGDPRQEEGSGIADRIALQVRGEVDLSDQPRGTPIGTATVEGRNVIDLDLAGEPETLGGAGEAETEPPEPTPTTTEEPSTPTERLERAAGEVTIEELNVEDVEVEELNVEDINVEGGSGFIEDIRERSNEE